MSIDILNWKQKQIANSEETFSAIKKIAAEQHFDLGRHNAKRLRSSLASVQRFDLLDSTLLSPTRHTEHSENLAKRFIQKWLRVKTKSIMDWETLPTMLRGGVPKPTDKAIAGNKFRFVTLLDSLTPVDSTLAFQAAIKMKSDLLDAITSVKGIWFLGAIEIEVISMRMMQKISAIDDNTESEKRKLGVCEILASEYKNTLFSGDTSFMLVHIHGVASANNSDKFEILRKTLLSTERWSRAPRQIEIKKLSEEYFGKAKSMERNLTDIARYITKGGNDWYAKKAYLRYKLHFQLDDKNPIDEETYTAKYWRRDADLKVLHKVEGITDQLSMTINEIAQLAIVIDELMGLALDRTGYLVRTGS